MADIKRKFKNKHQSFYPARQFRISDETYEKLLEAKKDFSGTWERFFRNHFGIEGLDKKKKMV